MITERLRRVPILAYLSDDEVERLAGLGRERRLAPGEALFRQGERASAFHIVLSGKLETTRDVAGEQVLVLTHGPDGYLGAFALLTDTAYRGSTTAVEDSLLFEVDGEEVRRLAVAHPPLLRDLLPAIESVSGAIKGVERDREKLIAVGRLAAGLAHELNNPAAAAARGVATLREYDRRRQAAFAEIADAGAPAEQLAALASLGVEATDPAVPTERLDPIARSDREQTLADDLSRRGVADAYDVAAGLSEAGLGPEWIDRVEEGVGREVPVARPALRRRLRRRAGAAAGARRGDDPHRHPGRRRQELLLPRPGPAPGRQHPRRPREHPVAPRARSCAPSRSRSSATSTRTCRASSPRAPS